MDDTELEEGYRCCGFVCCKRKKSILRENTENSLNSVEEKKTVYTRELPSLHTGHCIEIIGAPLDNCTRFSINFTCNKSPDSDIAFHFNPRLEQNYVVRNSRTGSRWGTEETVSCFRLNLPRVTQFKLAFFIANKEFLISINGKYFCSFSFRIALAKVKYLEIYGDVTIDSINIKEATQFPEEIQLENLITVPSKDVFTSDGELLQNPFIGHLPNGFKIGWQLEIVGKVKLLPHSFYINLQQGKQIWPHPIIPLHLNPRFNTMVNAHSLIRNAWINDSWGAEERSPAFNFYPGRNFHIVIQMESDSFAVWVDGKLEGEFKFRTTQNQIDTVYIQGDIYLYKIFTQDSFSNMLLDTTAVK